MSRSNTAPGPRGSRWLGMAPELQRDQLGTYERLVAEYGDVVRLVVGPPGLRRELYLVTHPDGVQQVLAGDPDGYSKNTPYYEEIAAYLGNGLLTSGGPRWRQQRRTVAPLFSHRRIASYVDVMAEEAARLADRCGVAAEAGLSIDVNAAMVDYTLRTVGRVLFGADVDDAVPVVRATFPVLNGHIRRRGLTPLRLPRRWPTPAQVRAAAAQRALYRIVDDIIDRRSDVPTSGPDLISLLLAARDPETGAPMSRQEIRDQVLIFLLAGHETTSTALTFTMQLLGLQSRRAGCRAPRDYRCARRPRAARRRHSPTHAHRDDGERGVAALSTGIRTRQARRARRDHRRPADPSRVHHPDQPMGDPSAPGPLARPPAVRSGAIRTGCRAGAPSIRLLPVCRRPSRLHRGPLRYDRGGRRNSHAAGTVLGCIRVARHPLAHQHHAPTRGSGTVPARTAAARSDVAVTSGPRAPKAVIECVHDRLFRDRLHSPSDWTGE